MSAELKNIDKYEVLSVLGTGSMGVVYKARDPEIGRLVAIKTLKNMLLGDDPAGKEALQRFRQEARSAGRLHHQNIVTIFEAGRAEDGSPYLVMECIEGKSLEALIKERGALEPLEALHYLAQVASAVDYAHSQNVIHRDIKPSNILVDGHYRVHLLDFGVAKLGDTSVTPAGTVVGTPSYMSPEQIRGEHLDGRSDLFSLAVVAFELFAGLRPFPGKDFTSVVGNIIHREPVKFEDVSAKLPESLENALRKGLAKNREERFQTAIELIDSIADALGIIIDNNGIAGGYSPLMKLSGSAADRTLVERRTEFIGRDRVQELRSDQSRDAVGDSSTWDDARASISAATDRLTAPNRGERKPTGNVDVPRAARMPSGQRSAIWGMLGYVTVFVAVVGAVVFGGKYVMRYLEEREVRAVAAREEAMRQAANSFSSTPGVTVSEVTPTGPVFSSSIAGVTVTPVLPDFGSSSVAAASASSVRPDDVAAASPPAAIWPFATSSSSVVAPVSSSSVAPASVASVGITPPVESDVNLPIDDLLADVGPRVPAGGFTAENLALLSDSDLSYLLIHGLPSSGLPSSGVSVSGAIVSGMPGSSGSDPKAKEGYRTFELVISEVGKRGGEKFFAGLLAHAVHPSYRVRVQVVKALASPAYLKRHQTAAVFSTMLNDNEYLVRGFAAKALGARGGQDSKKLLEKRLAAEENKVVIELIKKSIELIKK